VTKQKVYKLLFLISIMDKEQLKKLNKEKLIEIIQRYDEKFRVMDECSNLLRMDMR